MVDDEIHYPSFEDGFDADVFEEEDDSSFSELDIDDI
jgi:hypothetical protein